MSNVNLQLVTMQMEAKYQIEEAQGNISQARENFLRKYPNQEEVFEEMLKVMQQFYGVV